MLSLSEPIPYTREEDCKECSCLDSRYVTSRNVTKDKETKTDNDLQELQTTDSGYNLSR